jgi:hypothetical protein
MRRKTRSRPPAELSSSAQPSTPTVRLAELPQREPRSIRAAAVLRSVGTTAHRGAALGSCGAARRGAAAAQPRRAGCPAPGQPKP